MIVDCHTHIWESPDQLGPVDLGDAPRPTRTRVSPVTRAEPVAPPGPSASAIAGVRYVPAADPEHHWEQAAGPVDRSFVLGFKSRYLRAEVPDRLVADYVGRHPEKLIGFAGVDPTDPAAADDLTLAFEDLKLRGATVSPANQDFHPLDTRAMDLYEQAEKLGMPVVFHPGGRYSTQSKLAYGRPHLLDEVGRSFPRLKFVISGLGLPWVDEAITVLAKHPNAYADVSGLLLRPWAAYNALVAAHQADVIEKVLFGSDFPYARAADCIETLYSLNQMPQGTNLPVVPREALRGIVERDALTLLGLN